MDLGPSAAHCAIFAPSGPGSGAKFVQKAPLRYLPFYILLLLPFPISFRAFLQKSHKKSHKLLNILPNISKPSQPSLVHHGKLQLAGAHESHRLGIRRHMVSLDPELLRRDSAPASKTSKNHQFLKEFRPFRKWRTQIAKDWCLFLSGGENISRKVHTILYSFSAWMRFQLSKKFPHLLGRALASIKSFRPSFQHVRQYSATGSYRIFREWHVNRESQVLRCAIHGGQHPAMIYLGRAAIKIPHQKSGSRAEWVRYK